MEETESNLPASVASRPRPVRRTCLSSATPGTYATGEPVLTTVLPVDVACVVRVRTLEHPLHSGVFGGPGPDAMIALARLLATPHDENGDVAIDGVTATSWDGSDTTEDEFRPSADVLDGVQLTGTGPVRREAVGQTPDQRHRGRHD